MRTRISIAVGLVVVGFIWMGQGLGLLPGTGLMVGDARWAVAGAVAVAVGLVLGFSARARRPPA